MRQSRGGTKGFNDLKDFKDFKDFKVLNRDLPIPQNITGIVETVKEKQQ